MIISRLLAVLMALALSPTLVFAQGTPEAPTADQVCAAHVRISADATPGEETATAAQPVDVAALEFDLLFLDAMIPQLQSGIDLATVTRDRSERPEIDQITSEMIELRQAQVEAMTGWRAQWYPDIPSLTQQQLVDAMMIKLSDSPGMGGVAGLEEMDPDHRKAALVEVCESGDEVDIAFIDAMIAHNSGAIILAGEAENRSTRREVKEIAATIITTQQFEIDQLLAWRNAWFEGTPITHDHGV